MLLDGFNHVGTLTNDMESEVCVANPDAVAGVSNPPGTRAARYSAVE